MVEISAKATAAAAHRLKAVRVAERDAFEPPAPAVAASGALAMYRNPAVKNAVATEQAVGRVLDARA